MLLGIYLQIKRSITLNFLGDNTMKTFLITGGAGFIGHHFCEHFYKHYGDECKIILFDKLNYSGTLDRLRDVHCYPNMDIQVLTADFSQPIPEGMFPELENVTHIIHMGAETHVDNSIIDPLPFITSNVLGTHYMLELARKLDKLEMFYYFSTDEVFGPAVFGAEGFEEWDVLTPANPYAATKASGEMLCLAYENTYKIPVTITRTMNVFGERQHSEKFIPMCIKKILLGEEIMIHANKELTRAGSRQYIHARNVAAAYQHIVENGSHNLYHIVGEKEVDNLLLTQMIGSILKIKPKTKLVDFHSSRPGHDLRYALKDNCLKFEGYKIPKTFEESLEKTVNWYIRNPSWLGK